MKTWDDVLRQAACEVAGLTDAETGAVLDADGNWWIEYIHPALPAYVAELLVAKCQPHGNDYIDTMELLFGPLDSDAGRWTLLATAWQRILAAMVALGHMKLEQAREVNSE